MVLLVQFLNRIIYLCVPAIILVSCNTDYNKKAWVRASAHKYVTKGGVTYVDEKPFTGVVYELNQRDTVFRYTYKLGKQDGESVQWYPNGQLQEIRCYKDNRMCAEHRGWFENGKIKFISHYKDDAYDGNVKEWLESGQLFKDFNYRNGQEDGMQRMYWSDGRIRANYQCINGRNYGLTGVKNCVSVWADSVGH